MTELDPAQIDNPFDAIRQVAPDGFEYWSARDLQPVMGYSVWRDFANAIDRAKAACANSGAHVASNFAGARKVTASGPAAEDFTLTRYACYLTAMNGDPRKPQIAAAQTYFAVRTREAEAAPPRQVMPDLTSPAGILAMAQLFQRTAQQLVSAESQIAELEPKALAHDTFLAAAKSDRLVRQVAKDLGWREGVLRDFLLAEKLIYRRQRLCGGFEYDFYADFRAHFSTRETTAQHTWGPCNHYTLFVTPRGMELIHKRVRDRQAEQQAAIAGGARAAADA